MGSEELSSPAFLTQVTAGSSRGESAAGASREFDLQDMPNVNASFIKQKAGDVLGAPWTQQVFLGLCVGRTEEKPSLAF